MIISNCTVVFLAAAIFGSLNVVWSGYVMTENQIKADIKYLSQSMPNGAKPSRLRALLLADLRHALPKTDANCTTSDTDLTILQTTTNRCTCKATSYDCDSLHSPTPGQRSAHPPGSSNYGKRSSLIQRSCADYCCRQTTALADDASAATRQRPTISISATSATAAASALDSCEIAKPSSRSGNATVDDAVALMPGIVQIFAGKSKTPLCLGTLLHARVVMTTLVCATMQLNDRLRIKVRETVDRYQYHYQVRNVTRRIYPHNYAELYRQFGFNMALLLLSEPIALQHSGSGAQTRTTCWAHEPFDRVLAAKRGQRCYVDSLENVHGRWMERREAVSVYPTEYCQQRFRQQRREAMYFPKSTLCAGRPDGRSIEIFQNGAPLQCMHETERGSWRYVQHGMLAWSSAINPTPHLFANVSNYRNWLDKQLADVLNG